jgi:hypothetical protein
VIRSPKPALICPRCLHALFSLAPSRPPYTPTPSPIQGGLLRITCTPHAALVAPFSTPCAVVVVAVLMAVVEA